MRSRNDGFSPGFPGGSARRLRRLPGETKTTNGELMPNPNARARGGRIGKSAELLPLYFVRYFSGIGLSGRSESQKIVTIHHRVPSFTSWMLLMPRANGFGSSFV